MNTEDEAKPYCDGNTAPRSMSTCITGLHLCLRSFVKNDVMDLNCVYLSRMNKSHHLYHLKIIFPYHYIPYTLFLNYFLTNYYMQNFVYGSFCHI